ncbi:hypothetical protein [Rhizobacter sp. LjRoot28]|uniref:hypothetical protein n=1 Tax=Rhizobacter sp. LjRoot28 TaxID=3342309 RepID=UPI003ED13479
MNILDTLETDFECPLLVYTTSLETMPAMTVGSTAGDFRLLEAPVVRVAAPIAMLRGGRREGGSITRHAWMRNGPEMVGVMMAYIDQHFAAAVFDLGEPMAQESARVALIEGRTRFKLCHGSDEVLITPSLTMDCQLAFEEAQATQPATFMSFMNAMASLTRSFARAETFIGMGLDPERLKSVSVSMCTPAAAPSDTRVMEAKRQRGESCH